MIQAAKRLLSKKIPYVRRKWTRKTKIRAVIEEEPVKLTQYARELASDYEPFIAPCC